MSDHWLILIPETLGCVPSLEKQRQAEAKLREFTPDANKIHAEVTEELRFVDAGGLDFGWIRCPDCGVKLDLHSWCGIFTADGQGVRLKPHKMSCCGAMRNLHELHYEVPVGFARFSLTVRNPNLDKMAATPSGYTMPNDYIVSLQAILGCELRVVYRRI